MMPGEFMAKVADVRRKNGEILRRIGPIPEKDSAFWDQFFRR
jgi:hypothetical protein